jgi:hypothetical protein
MTDWKPMETAPKDRPILVRRNNDVFYEHHVVWWTGDEPYPWASDYTAYTTDRLDEWIDIPGMNLGSKRFERREGMSAIDEIAAEHWAVDVRVNGEKILTIESNHLSSSSDIMDYSDAVRTCAYHLLSFIGEPVLSRFP